MVKGNRRIYFVTSICILTVFELIDVGNYYGTKIFTTPTDGIAITEDHEAIFYCQVQGDTLYRLPTKYLYNFSTTSDEIDAAVQIIGNKEPSDGIKYWNGQLTWGSLTTSSYYMMNISSTSFPDMSTSAVAAVSSVENMHWVDTFAIDLHNSELMWFTSNKLDLFCLSKVDYSGNSGANYRVMFVDNSNCFNKKVASSYP